MNKVKGIHSVDFKVQARGHGCVNFNGNYSLWSYDAEKYVTNVKTPKLIGLSSMEDNKKISSKDIISNPSVKMFVSTNCLRHSIFKDGFPNHTSELTRKNVFNLLSNPNGLIRGYAITDDVPLMRKSCLLLEKAVDNKREFIDEILTTSGQRDNTSLFGQINAGETEYDFYGSINVEDLQFISTDNIFGRANALAEKDEVVKLAEIVSASLTSLSLELELDNMPVAKYGFWQRKGRVIKEGEYGILLNQDAIHTLVQWTIDQIGNLYINQAKGNMIVEKVFVDYNSGKHFRIKRDVSSTTSIKPDDIQYHEYYIETEPTHKPWSFATEEALAKSKSKPVAKRTGKTTEVEKS